MRLVSVETAQRSGENAPAPDCVVLKFGSSVLHNAGDAPRAVSEIYRHTRNGAKVVAVVSAFLGETDKLIADANLLSCGRVSRHAPRLIALGEERAAATLAVACDIAGVDAFVLGTRVLNLRAGGPADDAHPEALDFDRLRQALAAHDVVIVPGFAAVNEDGDVVLLGRGGSDLTAAFLAQALGLDEATLLKDVDGVYDCDPNARPDSARRYHAISWSEAKAVAGKLVQAKAIAFAQTRNVAIRVRRVGDEASTVIGAQSAPPKPPPASRRLRVAIAGLGVVGGGAALRLLREPENYELVGALVRNPDKSREPEIKSVPAVTDLARLFDFKPDVVIDALSSGEAGLALTEAALARGVSVVSANKQALAGRLKALHALAQDRGAQLRYAASVGGGAPILETVARAGAKTVRIEAIVNGTVNFILSGLQQGAGFEAAVAAAQAAGFAEEDPHADLAGLDAAAKAAILIWAAFGEDFDPDGITAQALSAERYRACLADGGVWRQATRIERGAEGARASVEIVRVDPDSLLGRTLDEGNGVKVECADGAVLTARGRGAGRIPTVESVLGDVGDVLRAIRRSEEAANQA